MGNTGPMTIHLTRITSHLLITIIIRVIEIEPEIWLELTREQVVTFNAIVSKVRNLSI